MKQEIAATSDPLGIELGRWLGRREAFAAIAGKCSAAEAQSLRRIRDDKAYKELGLTWDEFCSKKLGSSRRHVERVLRLLDEFGPAYFHVAQMRHVTPEEYRAIAPHVSAEGVELDGAVVALLPENSEQVSAAVAELLDRERPVKEKAPITLDVVLKRCEALARDVAGLEELQPVQQLALSAAVCRVRRSALKKGAMAA